MLNKDRRARIFGVVGLIFSLAAAYIFFFNQTYILILPIILLFLAGGAFWYFLPEGRQYVSSISTDAVAQARLVQGRRIAYAGFSFIAIGLLLVATLFSPIVYGARVLASSVFIVGLLVISIGGGLLVYRSVRWWRDYLIQTRRR